MVASLFREAEDGLHSGPLAWQPVGTTGQADLDRIINEAGTRVRGRNQSPAYLKRLAGFAGFMAGVFEGKIPTHRLHEAMSTSDFPLLMGDILDRQLLARYRAWIPTWQSYLRRGTVRDFRQARRIAMDGLEGRWYPDNLTAEYEPPQDGPLSETGYLTQVQVYQRAASISWRMLVNDDLDAFSDIPDRLAIGAARSEQFFATTLYVDSTGPHASLYTVGNNNIVTGNPALSIAALQTAMTVLAAQVDADGEPIIVDAVVLVVPPALEITALNILNALELRINEAGGVANQQLVATNWMRGRVTLAVDPYIPIVASGSNGNTSWFLFAAPGVSRPAGEVTFLRGFEAPSIYQKAPDTMAVGGGLVPQLGDFETNEIRYKGVHIFGGTTLDPKATVGSEGDGS